MASRSKLRKRVSILGFGSATDAGGLLRLVKQSAQRSDLLLELTVAARKFGKVEPFAGELAHLQHDGAAGGAAIGLDETVARGPEHEIELLAPLDQRIDGVIERLGRGRIEPGGEIEKLGGAVRNPERGGQGGDQKFRLARLRHGKKRLGLGRKHRFEHALARAVALGLALGAGLGFPRAFRGAETGDRRADGKGDDAEIDAEREQGACIERRRIARGKRGFERNQAGRNREGSGADERPWPPR